MWHDPAVPGDPESDLRAATRRRIAALTKTEQARAAERAAIVAALDGGLMQREIVEITGYTREHVRRIVAEVRRERGHD